MARVPCETFWPMQECARTVSGMESLLLLSQRPPVAPLGFLAWSLKAQSSGAQPTPWQPFRYPPLSLTPSNSRSGHSLLLPSMLVPLPVHHLANCSSDIGKFFPSFPPNFLTSSLGPSTNLVLRTMVPPGCTVHKPHDTTHPSQ